MAYQNFIPTVLSESISRDLERLCVFAEDCNRRYEGDVRSKGDAVTILGVGKPTIYTVARDAANASDITAAEEIEDTSVKLAVNQVRYFNYMVGDIDRAQAADGLLDALSRETSEGLAREIDTYIAALATDPAVEKLYASAPKLVVSGASTGEVNVLEALDAAIEKLYQNDVNPATEIVVTVSPRFYTLFKQACVAKNTDNAEILANGKVGFYGNAQVKLSVNVKTSQTTTAGDTDNVMIRTKRAIAFVNPLTHVEPYRPESRFADAVKGYSLFDAAVVRPKEIVNINVHY